MNHCDTGDRSFCLQIVSNLQILDIIWDMLILHISDVGIFHYLSIIMQIKKSWS